MANLNWNLAAVAEMSGGQLHGDPTVRITRAEIDSRQELNDALFVAIRGDRFDGHDFVRDAATRGARAALVEELVPDLPMGQIVVRDTIAALQSLSRGRRMEFQGPVVGITGSSGKTTTRRLVHGILSQKYRTHQPQKNFNNHIGVPLTLLALEPNHQACVLELGCSDFGEIETLTKISIPDIALVTNVGPAHLEKLGDLDGVARAKGELFAHSPRESTAVINLDDPRVARMPTEPETRLTFGTGENGDVRLLRRIPSGLNGQKLALEINGNPFECLIPLVGIHNGTNATAAIAVAVALGIEHGAIAAGLAGAGAEPGRLSLMPGPRESILLDDTYNANPASMQAAIRTAVELGTTGRTIAVIGDMLELGRTSSQHHQNIGEFAAKEKVDILVTFGTESIETNKAAARAGLQKDKLFHVSSHAAAVKIVMDCVTSDDVVLIKGSRGMQMDLMVEQLKSEEG